MKQHVGPALVIVGAAMIVVAVWLLWSVPAAVMLAGIGLVSAGLLVDFDD